MNCLLFRYRTQCVFKGINRKMSPLINANEIFYIIFQANCLQQNPLLQTSDPSEANEVIQDDLVSNHSDVIQADIMDPENETNYISIMPDNDIEQDYPELQDGSEIM